MKKRNFKGFIKWRDKVIKELRKYNALPFWRKWFIPKPEICGCIRSIVSLSWASGVHDIRFHVCGKHGKEFGIYDGPYWDDTIKEMQKESK
ncbi:MAG: hypothetical protein ACFFDN_24895 [Candidatus Hodarchaeota archaeon]